MAIPLLQPGAARPRRATQRRQLTVVPARRRVAWFAMSLIVLVAAVMMGAIGLHTRIAERQLEIDALERSVHSAQEEFDVLRSQRAELRSPTRVSERAQAIGMVIGSESEFVDVDPMTLAITIARTGHLPIDDEIVVGSDQWLEPLDQFRLVKAVSSEAP
jgi:cell division protein FtsL